ncbi:MAG: hypothetical protein IPM40_13585 [Gammaproteobacteria bacterium]|nr:hypothetical protein [Gammaproteobacteria bacterium]
MILANNKLQQEAFVARNIKSILFNQNAIVDERLFEVSPNVPKRFDAVYNARINPVKRHELAAKVENLALITIVDAGTDMQLFQNIRCLLPSSTCCAVCRW